MGQTATRLAFGLGIVYVLVGLVGFAVTGFSGFADTHGPTLLIFELNPLHNIVHLGVGAGLIAGAAAGGAGLRVVATTIAAVYALVGVLGLFIQDTALNILALNTADNFLHLGSAVLLFYVAAQTGRMVEARTA